MIPFIDPNKLNLPKPSPPEETTVTAADFSPNQIEEYLMMLFTGKGVIPPNLREWAEDQEWALPLRPAFEPADDGYFAYGQPMEESLERLGVEQITLGVAVPFQSSPCMVSCVYRMQTQCVNRTCDDMRLKYILEAGRDWYGMICKKCNSVGWMRERMMNPFTVQRLWELTKHHVLKDVIKRQPDQGWKTI